MVSDVELISGNRELSRIRSCIDSWTYLMLFRHDHETSSLHPEADVGTLAIVNGSLGNRRHQAITFPCLKFVNEKMSSSAGEFGRLAKLLGM